MSWKADETAFQNCQVLFRERKVVQLLWKTFFWFPKKLNIELPYDLAILFLLPGINSKGLRTSTEMHAPACL